MRGGRLPLSVAVAALGMAGIADAAPSLYLTARTTTIKTSSDGGASWSTFATVAGGALRGIDTDGSYVYVNNLSGGVDAATRPIYAYDLAGTQLASTTFNTNGAFNESPIGAFGGYMYANASRASGVANEGTGYSAFTGTSFTSVPVANAQMGNWQSNNMAFATVGSTNYMYQTGAGGNQVRRAVINANGTVSGIYGVPTSNGPTNFTDLVFTPSGRLLVVGGGAAGTSAGLYLSAPAAFASNSISLTQAFAFSDTENPAIGDMGQIARDFALLGNDLFAVTNTNIYRYTLNDTAGTLTFVSANSHGFDNAGVQITGIVPEPASIAALAIGALGLMFRRRRA